MPVMLETSREVGYSLRVSMPVNVRWPGEPLTMDNRFATVLVKLPAGVRDVRQRVLATKKRMDRLKRSPEAVVMFGAQNILLYLLPSKVGRKVVNFYGNKTTCVLTNVPGPQVPLAVEAAQILQDRGHRARAVSLPCSDVFDSQPAEYRDAVLPGSVRARIAIEAGVRDWWRKYVGLDGDVVGIDAFGESAPANELFARFGFTVERVVSRAERLLVSARQETAEAV